MKRKSKLLHALLGGLMVFCFVIAGYSFLVEPNLISLSSVPMVDSHLYPIFYDKKLVHISDLHITSVGYRERKLVDMLNRMMPDLLVITGDLLTNGKDEKSCIEVLGQIKKPTYGIWVVLGNADKYKDDESEEKIDAFVQRISSLGIKVLRDKTERLDLNGSGAHIFIVGVEGTTLSRSKLNWLLKDIPGNSPVIMLSHYPDVIDEHSDAIVVNLQVSRKGKLSGWGWQDGAFFDFSDGLVRFEKAGQHRVRVQRREDGLAVEQICLVPVASQEPIPDDRFPNPLSNDSSEIVCIQPRDVRDRSIFGSWKKVWDLTASINPVLKDMPASDIKEEFPLVEPANYFEAEFRASGNTDYHVWVRMKAEDDSISNDSMYIQFSDSIDQEGEPVYRIGELGQRARLKEVDLILAGHTHGGQVRFPIIGAIDKVPNHNIKHDMGQFLSQGTKMYVNRGIGTVLFPARLLCRPEITVFNFMKSDTMSMRALD